MDCSTPGFPVHHQLPEPAQIHVHQVGDPSNHLILCHPFSSCLQLFTDSRSFPMNWLFTSGGQSIRASSSAIVFPTNTQGLFPLGLAGLISLLSKGLSRDSVAQQQVTNTSAFSWGIVGSLQDGPRWFLHSFIHTLCSSVLHYTRIALQDHNIQQTC